jgi:hypothetical protein
MKSREIKSRHTNYQYNLITTKHGQIPIEEITEGEEVLSMGKWVKSPKPIKGTVLKCKFETLPTTSFEKTFATHKREVSICHDIVLNNNLESKPELAIRGYFRENKVSDFTLFKGSEDILYWLPKFIKLYDTPIVPVPTEIGYNFYHGVKKFYELKTDELSERNMEYVLEGLLRKSMVVCSNKFIVTSLKFFSETIRLALRMLDIECTPHECQKDYVSIDNPINLLRHIKDDYNKSKITDSIIVLALKKSNPMPLYTNGHKILSKTEEEGWILPGINPDINTINPSNCYVSGFTKMKSIRTEPVTKRYNPRWGCNSDMKRSDYLQDNFYVRLSQKNTL